MIGDGSHGQKLLLEAADMIESLRAKLAEAERELSERPTKRLWDETATALETLRERFHAERAKAEPIAWMVGNDPMTAAIYNKGEKEEAFDAARRWKTSITGLQVVAGAPTFAATQPPEQPQGAQYRPVGRVEKHTGDLKDMAIIVWTGEQPKEGKVLYVAD